MEYEPAGPGQLNPPAVKVGVTVIVAVTAVAPVLVAVKAGIVEVTPLAANPMLVALLVHE